MEQQTEQQLLDGICLILTRMVSVVGMMLDGIVVAQLLLLILFQEQ